MLKKRGSPRRVLPWGRERIIPKTHFSRINSVITRVPGVDKKNVRNVPHSNHSNYFLFLTLQRIFSYFVGLRRPHSILWDPGDTTALIWCAVDDFCPHLWLCLPGADGKTLALSGIKLSTGR